MDWMQWGLDALSGNDAAAEERREREREEAQRLGRIARGRAAFDRAGGSFGPHAGMQGAASMVGQGFANHAAAAGQINAAIGNEMQSRVAQLREMRRMQHEKDMERMRQEALLQRLQIEQQMQENRPRQYNGWFRRTLKNGKWNYE